MSQEIELKLLIEPQQRENTLNECRTVAQEHGAESSYQALELANAYFDTSDLRLRQYDMGLRIRRSGDQLEQTIKLAGRVLGGMHERPEYNLNVDSMEPDITLFDEGIWPDDFPVYDIQRDLQALFKTDFTRHKWHIPSGDGQIELVLDMGEIVAGEKTERIVEMELELQGGDLADVYRLAERLVKKANARMGSLSKAARGYLLAGKSALEPFVQTHFVDINSDYSLADALYKALEYGLRHWQHNEACLEYHAHVRAAQGMADGIYLCRAVIDQLRSLDIDCRDLPEQLAEIHQSLSWLKRFEGLAELTAEDGAYHRALKKQSSLYEHVEDTQQQVIQLAELVKVVRSDSYQCVLLDLSQFLMEKPTNEALEQPCQSWSTELLRNDWKDVQAAFEEVEDMSEERYLKLLPALQHSLMLGTCLGQLYDAQQRDNFRSPWLDLARGIREINALHILHEMVKNSDDLADEKLLEWQKVQRESLLTALEYSRKAALRREPYWQQ
ncbi:MAG: phosphate binding CYTH domain-containing protein [Idiomarina sp. T82-3]|uniref:CYTH domain-containing protein n=1 Tax=Idiomarina TaxID=135575 RepID=UPI000791B13B|nr:CYTH and CHAD domain-containing protein [Idiomarina sp. T82-3]KXS35019.1 MAG: phosphate binding CYTH domain-containing protein [Idiomarina sp. T82-3]